jgi:hypothetical protein
MLERAPPFQAVRFVLGGAKQQRSVVSRYLGRYVIQVRYFYW